MKILSLACLVGLLATGPLRAQQTPQEPVAPAPDPATPSAQPTPAPSAMLQQLLRMAVKALASEASTAPAADAPKATGGTDARSQVEQIMQDPTVQQFFQLAMQTLTDLQQQTKGDSAEVSSSVAEVLSGVFGGSSGGNGGSAPPTGFDAYSNARFASESGERRFDASSRTWLMRPWSEQERAQMLTQFREDYARLSPAELARWNVPSEGGGETAFSRAWNATLGTGGLRTSSLRTGGLRTGGLKTGRVQSGSASSPTLPQRDFVTPVASASAKVNTPAASASASVNAPPADPDEQMRRWSQGVDRQYASEQEARSAAMKAYPELAVANSAFNTQFLARYAQYQQADPFGFLRGPGWPMKLAIFVDGDLKRQKSGSAATP